MDSFQFRNNDDTQEGPESVNPVSPGDTNSEQASPNREEVFTQGNSEPTERDTVASTVVIASFEREATEARDAADPDLIADCQERYHEARLKRADQIITRRDRGE